MNDRARSAGNAPTDARPPAADWHPEPELISIRDAGRSREALRAAGADVWEMALEASGEGWLITTRLRGATYLRARILNTQSTTGDVDDLLELLRRLARDA